MRKLWAALAVSVLGWTTPVAAQQSVVVVELYTSQGCSSCPAADKILAEIAAKSHVLALGLHVDYWDYLGWKDKLARPEFTERQARFNTIMKSRYRLVTPQMIFNGQDYVAGAKRKEALKYIKMLAEEPERAELSVARKGGKLQISLTPIAGHSAPADVHVVRYAPNVKVAIKKGENAGHTIDYVNTVTDWATIGQWDGQRPASMDHAMKGDGKYAVIVQTKNLGPVLAARRVE